MTFDKFAMTFDKLAMTFGKFAMTFGKEEDLMGKFRKSLLQSVDSFRQTEEVLRQQNPEQARTKVGLLIQQIYKILKTLNDMSH